MKWANLSPEERNRLVAEKVMGWQSKECDGEIGELPISPDGWYCQRCGYSGSWGDDTTHEEIPPHYTQSMDRAWQVFQHMMQTYYPTRDEWRGPDYPIFRTFANTLVWFDDRPMTVYGDEIYPSEYFFEIVAKWTPENICFAALKAVGVDIE